MKIIYLSTCFISVINIVIVNRPVYLVTGQSLTQNHFYNQFLKEIFWDQGSAWDGIIPSHPIPWDVFHKILSHGMGWDSKFWRSSHPIGRKFFKISHLIPWDTNFFLKSHPVPWDENFFWTFHPISWHPHFMSKILHLLRKKFCWYWYLSWSFEQNN